MGERRRRQDDFLAGNLQLGHRHPRIAEKAALRVRHALWVIGRARGIEQKEAVIGRALGARAERRRGRELRDRLAERTMCFTPSIPSGRVAQMNTCAPECPSSVDKLARRYGMCTGCSVAPSAQIAA